MTPITNLMRRNRSLRKHLLAGAGLTLLAAAPVAAQKSPDLTPYLMASRDAEVALARSAAPASISGAAAVLVLTRDGFVEAAHGSNGFTCLVARSFNARVGDPDFWRPQVRAPHCLNPQASRSVLPEMKKREEWIMSGVSPSQIAARTRHAYAAHQFPMPEAGAMAYMLSPQQHLSEANPHWMPHLMFYFDRSMSASEWGAGGMSAPVINGSADDPSSPVLTLLVPVRQWSDGTTAMGR